MISLRRLQPAAEKKAVFLWWMKFSSGLRYGFPGALSHIGVEPDIVVYAKAMGNGFPFGTVIGREKIMAEAGSSFISSSYWTDGVGTAAAIAVLEKMQRLNVQEVLWARGVKFKEKLHDIASRYPVCRLVIGGMPVTPTLSFQLETYALTAKKAFIQKMLERGFLVSSSMYLMYAHEEIHRDALLDAMEIVLAEMQEDIISGKYENAGEPQGTQPGFARLA